MDGKIISAWVAFLGTLIVSGITIWQNIQIRRDKRQEEKRKRILERKISLERKLNEFYLPLRHHLENSKTLFKIFIKDKPNGFRTLTYLLDKKQLYDGKTVTLNSSDKAIFEKILEIGEKIENLTYAKSYLAGTDPEFVSNYKPRDKYAQIPYIKDMTILSLLVSHVVVIRLAYNGKLKGGNPETYKTFVFPNEVNIRVQEKIQELRNEIGKCEGQIIVTMN